LESALSILVAYDEPNQAHLDLTDYRDIVCYLLELLHTVTSWAGYEIGNCLPAMFDFALDALPFCPAMPSPCHVLQPMQLAFDYTLSWQAFCIFFWLFKDLRRIEAIN
jgi:hypothetical protein